LVLFQGVGKGISNKFQIGLLPFGLRAKRWLFELCLLFSFFLLFFVGFCLKLF
jgi:hypothetical protein